MPRQHRPCGGLGVNWLALAVLAPQLTVGAINPDHGVPLTGKEAGQTVTLPAKKLFRLYREERLLAVRHRGGRKRALGTRAPMPLPQASSGCTWRRRCDVWVSPCGSAKRSLRAAGT